MWGLPGGAYPHRSCACCMNACWGRPAGRVWLYGSATSSLKLRSEKSHSSCERMWRNCFVFVFVFSAFISYVSAADRDQKSIVTELTDSLKSKGGKVDGAWRDLLDNAIRTLESTAGSGSVGDGEGGDRVFPGAAITNPPEDSSRMKDYSPADISKAGYRLPIVYVFTVSKVFCEYGLPEYIKFSLIQSVMSQHDADVILVGNYKQCPKLKSHTDLLEGVIQIDTDTVASDRLRVFHNKSADMFQDDGAGNLWVTSALRFFHLEDMMIKHNMREVMHIEADNMLYGSFTQIIDVFRKGYKKLAATPLNSNKTFMTASVLWIADLESIRHFNNFLLALATNTIPSDKLPTYWTEQILKKIVTSDEYEDSKGKDKGLWDMYLHWFRPYSCCKHGGVKQDAKGMGIKPFAINEMSLMGFYHEIYPQRFQLLPIVPTFPYGLNRHIVNITEYCPLGKESGPDTHGGIWDPNSWGQYLGGTHPKNGRDKGFTDGSHIAGVAIRIGQCKPHMICGKPSIHRLPISRQIARNGTGPGSSPALECYTAPHVRCGNIDEEKEGGAIHNAPKGDEWTHLYNLHVHSKHTSNYVSIPCECGT